MREVRMEQGEPCFSGGMALDWAPLLRENRESRGRPSGERLVGGGGAAQRLEQENAEPDPTAGLGRQLHCPGRQKGGQLFRVAQS